MGKKRTKQKKGDKELRIILLAVVALFVVLSISSVRLYQKKAEYAVKEAELMEKIESEEARTAQIDAYEEYVGTDAYVEQIARERLGLAYPNEILFRPEE